MKSKITPIVVTFLVILLVIGAVRYMTEPSAIEPFAASSEPQCNALTNCATCAAEDKCGWCSSTKKCHLKGKFGDSDGKCPADKFVLFEEQCTAPSTSLSTSTSGGSTYNAGREKRRLAMIKKYVDRIGMNYNALTLASSKTDARDYISKKLTYSESD
jgi:uncharacterized low-complexity protein